MCTQHTVSAPDTGVHRMGLAARQCGFGGGFGEVPGSRMGVWSWDRSQDRTWDWSLRQTETTCPGPCRQPVQGNFGRASFRAPGLTRSDLGASRPER